VVPQLNAISVGEHLPSSLFRFPGPDPKKAYAIYDTTHGVRERSGLARLSTITWSIGSESVARLSCYPPMLPLKLECSRRPGSILSQGSSVFAGASSERLRGAAVPLNLYLQSSQFFLQIFASSLVRGGSDVTAVVCPLRHDESLQDETG
jgi:hypothetical protein